jgi:hypothetical protein
MRKLLLALSALGASGAALFGLGTGCSSSVDVLSDASSSGTGTGGGGSGSAGSGGSSASSSSTGASSSASGGMACPTDQPKEGDVCSPEGQSCTYGACCPSIATCKGGHWTLTSAQCPEVPCPDTVPENGSPCTCQGEGKHCVYDACGLSATCVGQQSSVWNVEAPPSCAFPCGPSLACTGGDVCVISARGAGFTYACAPYPCAPTELSCGCAASLCGPQTQCTSASNGQVHCDCLRCQ